MTLFSYLDLTNTNRIGLSVHDPFAIFAFACLCAILLLLVLLLACTARRSADEIWSSTHLSRGADYHVPAYKRHRKSVWSLSSGSGAEGRGSVAASLLPTSRGESSLPLISNAENSGGTEGDTEMMFSPQAVSGRFLDSQTSDVEVAGGAAAFAFEGAENAGTGGAAGGDCVKGVLGSTREQY